MKHFLKTGALLAFLFCYGCKDSPTNSGVPGKMTGDVIAFDSTGTNRDNSGVKISIDGTSYSTLSDSAGRWELDNVPPGTYDISFSKDRYAAEKMIAYRFVGNGTDYLFTTKVYQIMETNGSLVIRPLINGKAIFSCRLFRSDSAQSLNGSVILLLGRKYPQAPEKPDSYLMEIDNFLGLLNSVYPDSITGYSIAIDSSELVKYGFHSKDTIFCEAYVSNLLTIEQYDAYTGIWTFGPSYFDITTRKRVYTGFGNNHSEVKSFILP